MLNAKFEKWLKETPNILIVNENTDVEKELRDRHTCGTIDIWIENTDTVFRVLVFFKENPVTYDVYKFKVHEDYFEEIEDYRQINIKETVEIIKK